MCSFSCSEVNYHMVANKTPACLETFPSNYVASGFAVVVDCHISVFTVISLCICKRNGFFFQLGLHGLPVPLHVMFELDEVVRQEK